MAHFAELDENNVVTRVIVVGNGDCGNLEFPERDPIGVAFCKKLFGENIRWVQTSYNSNFRRVYAGIGFTYHAGKDVFVPPSPGDMYIWDENTANWIIEDPQVREVMEQINEQ